jgi:hypothetical protein
LNHKKLRVLVVLNLLALAALLFSFKSVGAQTTPAGLEMQAQAAFEGNFKYGEWLPILVTLENSGADLDAVVQAQINQSGGNVTFARRVSLPYNSRKQVVLYVLPNNFSREIELQLLSEDTLLASQILDVSPIQTDTYLIGIAAPNWGPLSQLSRIKFERSPRDIVLADLDLTTIPEKSVGLSSFDVIILNDVDTSSLSEKQQQTLAHWVENCGFLVIGGGSGIEKTSSGLPDSLVNFDFQENIQSDALPGLEQMGGGEGFLSDGPFIVSRIRDSENKSFDSEVPILHQWQVGKGAVNLIALSLTDAPFNTWSGTTEFWQNLLTDDAFFSNWMPRDASERQLRSSSMSYPLFNLPALDLPSLKGLGALLIVYIIVIGPVNYLVLKRKNKLQLAWGTIPALTVIFAASAFGLAYIMRGNDIVTNKLSIISLNPEGYAQIDSYIGLFSPAQESYEVEVIGDMLLSPFASAYYDPWRSYEGPSVGETIFLQGDPAKVIGLDINQWSMQSFNSENMTAFLGKIDSQLVLSGETLSGSIQNQMEVPIEDAVLIFGESIIYLGDFAPGESTTVEHTVSEQPVGFFRGMLTHQILESSFPGGSYEYQRDYELRRSFLDAAFHPIGFWMGPKFEAGSSTQEDSLYLPNVYLLGWVEESPPEIMINGRQATQNTLGLLTTHLPFQLVSGDYHFPTTLIEGRVINQTSNLGYCEGTSTNVYLDTGSAEFEFTIPPALLNTDLESLLVEFQEEAAQWDESDTSSFSLSIFNWEKGQWSVMSNIINGINSIDDVSSFIDQNGVIRLKLEREVQNPMGCVLILVGLEGTKP